MNYGSGKDKNVKKVFLKNGLKEKKNDSITFKK